MLTVDYVFLGIIALSVFLGSCFGFGKCLKFISDGFFGKVISVIVTYFLLGLVLDLGFVQDFMRLIVDKLTEADNVFCSFLITIRIDIIAVGAILFIIVQLVRKFLVGLIIKFFEINNKVMKVVNKSLGGIIALLYMLILVLVVFQIIIWLTGEGGFYEIIQGSTLGIDKLYLNNPLISIIRVVKFW